MYERFATREERKGYENNINKLMKAQAKFRSGEVQLEVNNPDQIQQVINKVWEEDVKIDKQKSEELYKDSHGNSNFLTKLSKMSNQALEEILTLLGRFVAYDKHTFTRVSQDDAASILNPLSSLHDRFHLKHPNLQKALFKNNVEAKMRKKNNKSTKREELPPV